MSHHKEEVVQNQFRGLKEGLYLYLTKYHDQGFAYEQVEVDSDAESEECFLHLARKDKRG